ncbi:class I SAM-dependent methyltransferase [Candidatus Woesearchaeota archaeon]|nr:class I SAM-dependent methyltransferase [Candidatus Woesearchaeota archaeon]
MPKTKTIYAGIYDYPLYYDVIFASEWKPEFNFILNCCKKHAQRKVKRLFEPACGTGRLILPFAKVGYQISGLDLSKKMVEFCNQRLKKHNLPPAAFVGDMADFRLPEKIDAAFNMINSFRELTSEQQARSHLQCISRALHQGGLYILGLHLIPTQGLPLEDESWSASRGRLHIKTYMKTIKRDLNQRQEKLLMRYDITTPIKKLSLIDENVLFRTYTRTQFKKLLKTVPSLEVAETYDFSYQIDQPINATSQTQDIIFVLRKK